MNQFQAMIEKNNTLIEGGIGLALGVLVREFEARSAALETKINRLEAAASEFKFVGQWQEHKTYKHGNFVTTGGQVWHCNADTNSRPGTDSTWSLAVKSGRDGRDGKDAPPPEPPAQRTVRTQR